MNKSKAKGNRLERKIVDTFEEAGFDAERAYGSNGWALGEAPTVDNVAHFYDQKMCIQAKARKQLPAYIKPPVGADATIIKEDRGDMLIVMNLEYFLSLVHSIAVSPDPQSEVQELAQDSGS